MPLRILRVALDTQETHVEELPAEIEQLVLGGRGAATWWLTHRLPPNTGPLSPANPLIFSVGALAGMGLPATGGFVVSTRSPLTRLIAHSWGHGSWGNALRRAGFDLLVLEGQSSAWCVLQIDDGAVQFLPAEGVAGSDTRTTNQQLLEQLGEDYRIACLGMAGEAGVAYSSIVAEGAHIAEPAGTGAIMAHKRVKAIAVRGTGQRTPADAERVAAVFAGIERRIAASELASGIRQFGSLFYSDHAAEWGALTGRNGQEGRIPHLAALGRVAFGQRGKRVPSSCDDSPLPCNNSYVKRNGEPMAFPNLEALAGFGGWCGIANIDSVIFANDLCLRLGLDPVAASAAIGFMMECQQRGLNRSGTLPWGDDDAVLLALERLSQRQEKRDVLSLGVGEMKEIFFGSENFAPQVKNMAMPAIDPRAMHEIALAVAASPIGGDYRYAMAYEELLAEPPPWLPDEPSHPQAIKGKAVRLIWHERFAAALDAAGFCRRLALLAYQVMPTELTELIGAALGRTFTSGELARLGERIVTLERVFARRDGAPDTLPARWLETPLSEGRASGHLPALDDLLGEYYRRHGWDQAGDPTPERLHELGLATD